MLADVLGQNLGCFILADARSKRLVQISAAVAETISNDVENAARVVEMLEADGGSAGDAELFAAAAHSTQVEIGHEAVTQEALLLLGVVQRVEPATETEWCR